MHNTFKSLGALKFATFTSSGVVRSSVRKLLVISAFLKQPHQFEHICIETLESNCIEIELFIQCSKIRNTTSISPFSPISFLFSLFTFCLFLYQTTGRVYVNG